MKVYIVGDKCFHYTESVGHALETLGGDVKDCTSMDLIEIGCH